MNVISIGKLTYPLFGHGATDTWCNGWYARVNIDGTQTWASVRGGVIQNCGENDAPHPWDPETGLSANKPRRNGFKRG